MLWCFTVIVVVVGRGGLDEEEVFLEVGPAEELAGADDELVAFLERPAADEAAEARQVEGQRGSGTHDQLVRIEALSAATALGPVHSEHQCIQH